MAKKTENKDLQQMHEPATSLCERFTNKVIGAYSDIAKGVSITQHEKALIANYFVGIDKMLQETVIKKGEDGYTWSMVDMNALAISVAHMARLGLDMGIDNMISFIPFKKGSTGKVTLAPVRGYKGYEYLAKRYGLEKPKNSVVELVHETDTFRVVKKDITHNSDSYVFEISNPFNRGSVIGGFGYLEFEDSSLNKLIVMSKEQILSYRKQYYDKNFWTGENEKKMFEKTIAKQLFRKVTLDPEKVNAVKDSWDKVEAAELEITNETAKETIASQANQGAVIDISDDWQEVIAEPPVDNSVETVDNPTEELPKQDTLFE